MKTISLPLLCLVLSIAVVGCQKEPGSTTETNDNAGSTSDVGKSDAADHGVEGHSHEDPPHDGTVVDWGGGKYHLEFVVDHEKQEATVYILDFDVKTNLPISTKEINLAIKEPAVQLKLTARPQEGDPDGLSSRFVGNHENLGPERLFEGTLYGNIEDVPYSGDFKEEDHEHDDE